MVNADLDDLVNDANAARPLTAGGTGGTSQITGWDGLTAQGTDIPSASTINLTTATGPRIDITGTTTITAVTLAAGSWRIARAAGAFQLTASSTLVVNGSMSTNDTTNAGDLLIFFGYSASTVRVWRIPGGAGLPLTGGTLTGPLTVNTAAGTNLTLGGQTAQFPTSLTINPTGHATSRRATLALDQWLILQDSNGNGTKDFGIYNAGLGATAVFISSSNGIVLGAATGGAQGAGTINANTYYKGGNYGVVTLGTVVNTTSGTAVDVTGIPAGVRRVSINLNGVSVNAAASVILQLGNGSVVTTGYNGSCVATGAANALTTTNFTAGFCFSGASTGNATSPAYGTIVLSLIDATNNVWACGGWNGQPGVTGINVTGGEKALSSALDRIRLTTVAGTATFNAGSINISYE